MEVNNIILPKTITWHAYEGKVIKEATKTVHFENVTLSENLEPASYFEIPDGGIIVEREKG